MVIKCSLVFIIGYFRAPELVKVLMCEMIDWFRAYSIYLCSHANAEEKKNEGDSERANDSHSFLLSSQPNFNAFV